VKVFYSASLLNILAVSKTAVALVLFSEATIAFDNSSPNRVCSILTDYMYLAIELTLFAMQPSFFNHE
jgi:hypothetical protein